VIVGLEEDAMHDDDGDGERRGTVTCTKWHSVSVTAKRYGVSPSLVYQWCHERRLPHVRLGKASKRGKILIDEADAHAFFVAAKVEAAEGSVPTDAPTLRHITQK